MTASPPLGRALAASVTPLTAGGDRPAPEAVVPLVDRLVAGGIDGVLALGTTGEGMLLDPTERRHVLEAFVGAAAGRISVVAHCGAQTTRDTADLCAHAAAEGADAAAVIAPPYFALDDVSLVAHFTAAASACAPLPFVVYEFAARSGYAVSPRLVAELRERIPSLAAVKVSDSPWDRFEPYLLEGLAVYVGPEALIGRGMAAGAVGAVSGLAAALPEAVVAAVHGWSPQSTARVGELRAALDRFPFHAALKRLLIHRGVPIEESVRAPLRGLTAAERDELDALAPSLLAAAAGEPAPAPGRTA